MLVNLYVTIGQRTLLTVTLNHYRVKSIYLEEEISPDHVQDLESAQEAIEDVVGGEELNVPLGVVQGGVEDVCWVDPAPE